MQNPHIIRSTGNPVGSPPESGIHWINSTTGEEFFSVDTLAESNWVPRTTGGVITDHTGLSNIGTNTHAQIDTHVAKLENVLDKLFEPTGFVDNSNIQVLYNPTTRKVQLVGNIEAYRKGVLVPELINGWESQAHADVAGNYFLHVNCSDGIIVFDTTPWHFDCLQIAFISYIGSGVGYALTETHGFLQWQAHKEFHELYGTYKQSGADFSSYVLNSNVLADRRLDISGSVLQDEDLATTLDALTNKLYNVRKMVGASTVVNDIDQADIIPLSGTQPYYNLFNGSVWSQALMTNNNYAAIFVMAVPTSHDANSKKYRYQFIQPQTQNATLSTIQALTASSLNLGESSALLSEFCIVGKIIIRYTAGNWVLISVEKISGTKTSQTVSTQGSYISSVAVGDGLSGNGTPTNPIVNEFKFSGFSKITVGIVEPIAPSLNDLWIDIN